MTRTAFSYEGLQFVPLVECDLDRIAPAFDCPDIMKLWSRTGALSPRDYLEARWKHDIDGDSLTLIASQGRKPLALISLHHIGGVLRTSTYIVPVARGFGVNLKAKTLQATLARLLGLPLVARIPDWNERSQRALLKLWPDAPAEPYSAEPPLYTTGEMFYLNGLPLGATAVPLQTEAELLRLLAMSSLGRIRAVASGPAAGPTEEPDVLLS